jgi:protein phosphatase
MAVFQYYNGRPAPRPNPAPAPTGGKGPYRRYDAAPTIGLSQSLKGTVEALREAAVAKSWAIDWSAIEEKQRLAEQAIEERKPREAVRHQSEAIIETMRQLREQHHRALDESAIDR